MYRIDKTRISLIRGDTFIAEVGIYVGDEPYVLQQDDEIHFLLKRADLRKDQTEYINKTPVVEKVISNNDLILRLESSDTADLPFGRYVYDVQLKMSDGTVDTFIFDIFDILSEEEAAQLLLLGSLTSNRTQGNTIQGKLSVITEDSES